MGILGRFGVVFQAQENILPFGFPEGGSTHQSGYHHDRHVPLMVWGSGVTAGRVADRVSSVDVAPTLAALMGLSVPDGLDGVARAVR